MVVLVEKSRVAKASMILLLAILHNCVHKYQSTLMSSSSLHTQTMLGCPPQGKHFLLTRQVFLPVCVLCWHRYLLLSLLFFLNCNVGIREQLPSKWILPMPIWHYILIYFANLYNQYYIKESLQAGMEEVILSPFLSKQPLLKTTCMHV